MKAVFHGDGARCRLRGWIAACDHAPPIVGPNEASRSAGQDSLLVEPTKDHLSQLITQSKYLSIVERGNSAPTRPGKIPPSFSPKSLHGPQRTSRRGTKLCPANRDGGKAPNIYTPNNFCLQTTSKGITRI